MIPNINLESTFTQKTQLKILKQNKLKIFTSFTFQFNLNVNGAEK